MNETEMMCPLGRCVKAVFVCGGNCKGTNGSSDGTVALVLGIVVQVVVIQVVGVALTIKVSFYFIVITVLPSTLLSL